MGEQENHQTFCAHTPTADQKHYNLHNSFEVSQTTLQSLFQNLGVTTQKNSFLKSFQEVLRHIQKIMYLTGVKKIEPKLNIYTITEQSYKTF